LPRALDQHGMPNLPLDLSFYTAGTTSAGIFAGWSARLTFLARSCVIIFVIVVSGIGFALCGFAGSTFG
jgi:hypothetical protein